MRQLLLPIVLSAAATAGCQNGAPGAPASPTPASGGVVTLVDVTDGLEVTAGQTGTFNWAGQSVTLPAGGSYTGIRFNWYTFKKEPAAFGRLSVLAQEYLGLPGDLGPATPGFLGRSQAIDGGQYVFPSSVVLAGGTKYWFYTDAQGSFAGSFDTDIYAGGDMYVSGYSTVPFRRAHASGRMVNGTLVPAPEGVYVDANFKLQGVVAR